MQTPFDGATPNAGSGLSRLGGNLRQGLRMLFLLRVEADRLAVSWSQIVALSVLSLAVPLFTDLWRIGPQGSFAPDGLPGALFTVPVTLFAAWAFAALAGQTQRTMTLWLAFSAVLPLSDLVYVLAWFAVDSGHIPGLPREAAGQLHDVCTVWFALAAVLGASRLLALSAGRTFAAAMAAGLLVTLPLTSVWRNRSLWLPAYDEQEAGEASREDRFPLASEDAFYLQPQLLEQQLAALEGGRPGTIDLYFVGAAGYAGQDVFMKEVRAVARLFAERFDTQGRSVTLINNPATVAEVPIASTTSLRRAFGRVAEIMDRDEDILFLFLTSHGSQDHRFSLDFWPLRFNALDPQRLRELLDESGIARRVIVVSACYSGGFIDALRDDNTLVIAASAPDRNSFGCSNEAEFTYFGKAYFDEALRRTRSFIDAFEIARPLIAQREQEQDFKSSDPRISIGQNIRPALDRFLAQERR